MKKHKFDVYPYDLHLITDEDEYRRFLKRIGDDDYQKERFSAGVTHFHNTKRIVVIYIDKARYNFEPGELAEIAAHEATHAAGIMFENMGQPHSSEHDEAWAYLIGFITKFIVRNV